MLQFEQRSWGTTVIYNSEDLYPGGDPLIHFDRVCQSLRIDQPSLVIIPSPLLCLGIASLRAKLPVGSVLIAIELETALAPLIVDGIFDIVITPQLPLDDSRCFPSILQTVLPFFRKLRKVVMLSATRSARYHSGKYREIEVYLRENLLLYWRDLSTILYHGRRWIRNFLMNSIYSEESDAQSWEPDATHRTAQGIVVCGAGPSLDLAMDDLSEFRSKIFIIAVDTALGTFLDKGMLPDACVVLEGQWHNLADFSGLPTCSGMEIWTDIWAHHPTLRTLHDKGGKIRFFSSLVYPSTELRHALETLGLPIIPPLGSVGVAAIELGLRMAQVRSIPMGVIGVDFVQGRGQNHAKGTPSHRKGLAEMTRIRSHPWLSGDLKEDADRVLASYAELAQRVTAHRRGNVVDLRTSGRDIGLMRANSRTWLDGLSSHGASSCLSLDTPKATEPLVYLTGSYSATLVQKLNRLVDQINENIDRMAISSTLDSIHGMILELDYLFMDFPDKEWPPLYPEALARVRVRCREIMDIVSVSRPLQS